MPRINNFIRITYNSSRQSACRNTGKRGVWVTQDHKILTTDGYIEAENLNNKNLILSNQGINEAQKHLIFGSLLGDGALQKSDRNNSNRYRFSTAHTIKNSDWLNIKYEALKSLNPTKYNKKANKQSKEAVAIQCKYDSCWQKFR